MATTTHDTRPSIGAYRKLRLHFNNKGYWEIRWTAADEGSITKRHSTRERELAKAEAYFAEFCADRRAETAAVAAARPPSVEDLCKAWLDYVEAAGKAETGRRVLAAVRR